MAGYTFNAQLYALRLARGLSRKEAAKAIGMSHFRLYLYEKGYFRPRGKALTKLESFYETAIDFAEEKDYPALLREEQNEKKPAFARKKRLIVYGVLAATMAATLSLGRHYSSARRRTTPPSMGRAMPRFTKLPALRGRWERSY